MASVYTAQDGLRIFLTGDPSDASPTHAKSLGGAKVPFEIGRRFQIDGNTIPGMFIEHIGNGVPIGDARIEVVSQALKLYTNGEAVGGAYATLPAAGDSVVIQSASVSTGYARLCNMARQTEWANGASFELKVLPDFNNVIGMGDVSTAGNTIYRAVMLQNMTPETMTVNVSRPGCAWLDFGQEAVDASNEIQIVADETTAPTAISFASTQAITIEPYGYVGLWIRRTLSTPTVTTGTHSIVTMTYTVSGVTYTITPSGYFRVFDTDLNVYELYVGEDAQPDFDVGPESNSASLPIAYIVTPPVSGETTFNLTTCLRNRFNLRSANRWAEAITIDSTGALVTPDVSTPTSITVTAVPNARLQITAQYMRGLDTTDADKWKVWITDDGTAPDPADPVTATVDMEIAPFTDTAMLNYTTDPDYQYGATCRVLVRAYRSTDTKASTNTTDVSCQMTEEPYREVYDRQSHHGEVYHDSGSVVNAPLFTLTESTSPKVELIVGQKAVYLWAAGHYILAIDPPFFKTTLTLDATAISGTPAHDGLELEDSNTIYLAADGVRLMKLDLSAGVLQCESSAFASTPSKSFRATPLVIEDTSVLLNVFADGLWKTAAEIDANGLLTSGLCFVWCATEAELFG